jgi:hypothetical protein
MRRCKQGSGGDEDQGRDGPASGLDAWKGAVDEKTNICIDIVPGKYYISVTASDICLFSFPRAAFAPCLSAVVNDPIFIHLTRLHRMSWTFRNLGRARTTFESACLQIVSAE